MRNEYMERIGKTINEEGRVSKAEWLLYRYYKNACFAESDKICIEDGIDQADALKIADALRKAGINELYVTGEWSNQFSAWYAMELSGLKLKGIEVIENPKYAVDMRYYGCSREPKTIYAMKFSFDDDKEEE
jgi:hypothetical protein